MTDCALTIEEVEREIRDRPLVLRGDDVARAHYVLGQAMGLALRHRAERDRLQAEKAHLVEVNAILRSRPDLAERAPLVVAVVEDRNRLRAVVHAAATELDALAERTGHGDIGDVVTRMLDAAGLDALGHAKEGT